MGGIRRNGLSRDYVLLFNQRQGGYLTGDSALIISYIVIFLTSCHKSYLVLVELIVAQAECKVNEYLMKAEQNVLMEDKVILINFQSK